MMMMIMIDVCFGLPYSELQLTSLIDYSKYFIVYWTEYSISKLFDSHSHRHQLEEYHDL